MTSRWEQCVGCEYLREEIEAGHGRWVMFCDSHLPCKRSPRILDRFTLKKEK